VFESHLTFCFKRSTAGIMGDENYYDQRLIFRFMDEAHTIVLLIDIGTHDKVY